MWWGEATDEPAREEARPTVYAAPTGLGNWVARVATKISLLTKFSDGVRLCPTRRAEARRRWEDQSRRVRLEAGEANSREIAIGHWP